MLPNSNMLMLLSNMTLPFSEIIKTEIYENEIKLTELADKLSDFGITAKRLSEYQNGFCNPPFEKAKAILDCLGFEMDNKELIESLRLNKEVCKENKSYIADRYKFVSVRLNLRKIMPEKEPEYVENMINLRLKSLYHDEKQIGNYIHDLISKDLNEFILEEDKNDKSN